MAKEEEEEEDKNMLAAATAAAAAGSIAIVEEEDEKDDDDRRGMDDGTESALGAGVGCRLRFFGSFFSFFGSFFFSFFTFAQPPGGQPTPGFLSYPSQSGQERNPFFRYLEEEGRGRKEEGG